MEVKKTIGGKIKRRGRERQRNSQAREMEGDFSGERQKPGGTITEALRQDEGRLEPLVSKKMYWRPGESPGSQ